MKKIIVLFVVCAMFTTISVSNAKASTIDDLMAQITSLQKKVTGLQSQMSALVLKGVSGVAQIVIPKPPVLADKQIVPYPVDIYSNYFPDGTCNTIIVMSDGGNIVGTGATGTNPAGEITCTNLVWPSASPYNPNNNVVVANYIKGIKEQKVISSVNTTNLKPTTQNISNPSLTATLTPTTKAVATSPNPATSKVVPVGPTNKRFVVSYNGTWCKVDFYASDGTISNTLYGSTDSVMTSSGSSPICMTAPFTSYSNN